MLSRIEKLIAVVGATGQQRGAVVRGLQTSSQFKVRAPSRNPDKHRELADEVVKADLNHPETLKAGYLGSDSYDRIALANKIAGGQPTNFSTWARANFPARVDGKEQSLQGTYK